MDPVTLVGTRLVLTVPTSADIDTVAALCDDELLRDTLAALPWPYTRSDAESFVAEHVPAGWASGRELTWAIREGEGGALLGVISWRRDRGDIGFWLGAPARGRGLMVDAVRLVADFVFEELGAEWIGWEALVGNVASARVARAAGFAYTGERASEIAHRDGSHPRSWHAVLDKDDRDVHPEGWPL